MHWSNAIERIGRVVRIPGVLDALPGVQRRWTSGRRTLAPAGVIALIVAVATSALLASAGEPTAKTVAASRSVRPNYLLPMGALLRGGSLPQPALTGDQGTVGVPGGTPKTPKVPNPVQMTQQAPIIAPYQGSAGTLTPAGIATLALEHGCTPRAGVIATAIAMAESGGSPSAQGDIGLMTSVWDWSAGLWQIRGLRAERNTGQLRDSVANQGVDNNAAAMNTISQGCTGWTPWSTYTSGAYLQFMTLARAAVQYVVAFYNAHGHHYPPVPAPDPTATIPSQGTSARAAGQAAPTAAPGARTSRGSGRPSTKPARSTAAANSTPGPKAPAASANPKQARPRSPLPTTAPPSKTSLLPVPLPIPIPTLPLPLPPLPTLPHLP